jgi:hypothetical protein
VGVPRPEFIIEETYVYIIIIIIIYSCGYSRMIFSDDSAGICKDVVIGLYKIAWWLAQVSATLKRTGVDQGLQATSGVKKA